MFIGLGSSFFSSSILILFENNFFVEAESIFFLIKLLPLVVFIIGFFLAIPFFFDLSVFAMYLKFFFVYKFVYLFLNRLWFFDVVYNNYIVKKFLNMDYFFFFKSLDKGVLEFFFFYLLTKIFSNISMGFVKVQTGFVFDYLFLIFFNLIVFFFFFNSFFTYEDFFYLILLKLYFFL